MLLFLHNHQPPGNMETRASQAIATLYDEYADAIRALGIRTCGNRDHADDLVQETFLSAFRAWHTFRGDSSAKTWLFRIAMRACMRMSRKRVGEPEFVHSVEHLMQKRGDWLADSRHRDPIDELFVDELRTRIDRAIAKIPHPFRTPLVLRDIEGISTPRIAASLGVKHTTARTRLHRGRRHLRDQLQRTNDAFVARKARVPRVACITVFTARRDCIRRGVSFCLSDDELRQRCARNCALWPTRPGRCPAAA
jgi:RNA polymerase sigma-70 factor (ECF subfamily)